ncbi:heterokaryon incompatibility protein-domain-containing protein [Leptodontidium sp. MPI-SDFR-AT-0119]|nr:heterokaryon incompatibility protein-domain-containing protein [Leptodontidium sp. MPI-SDFR-AT-0119]
MRLLHAKTRELHTKTDNEIPDYAILSHTWHSNKYEEVLLEDLQDISRASKKAGFAKIGLCCEQALRDCLEWVWIDTCCIEKASSTELSEAINSMYRWYQNAKVCYAYLEDIPSEYTREDLQNSRWFKRAWTLQELLAPMKVVFYSKEWLSIGTKASLQTAISEITGIDENYLARGWLPGASVAKRMSWAANREATRSEDIAYSLFGIFNVHMPLLYGEGQLKAFRRLQEEIMRTSNDHTLLAWEPSRKTSNDSQNEESASSIHRDGSTDRRIGLSESRHEYGLLATCPADFLGSCDLVPIPHNDNYNLTNTGLQIKLRLSQEFTPRGQSYAETRSTFTVEDTTYELLDAYLSCRQNSYPFRTVAIMLQPGEPGRCRRRLNSGLKFENPKALSRFVKQEIFIENKDFEDNVSRLYPYWSFILLLPHMLEVVEVYPPEFWFSKHGVVSDLKEGENLQHWCACLLINVNLSKQTQIILVLGKNYNAPGDRPLWVKTVDFLFNFYGGGLGGIQVSSWCKLLKVQANQTLEELHQTICLPESKIQRKVMYSISDTNDLCVEIQGWRYVPSLFKTLNIVEVEII